MDNITHSLLGVALAELALPAAATKPQRRAFFVTGIIAANLPDADLVYTGITPGPLVYLLHHRGHTHTLVGLVAQALLIGAVCLLPAIRRRVAPLELHLGLVVALALVGHLVLDSWNSYGVHPFWPWDVRWFYGDAIFILEPWLWLLLGVAAALNLRDRRGRAALAAALVLIVVVPTLFGMLRVGALAALLVAAGAATALSSRWTPRVRSGTALATCAMFVAVMFVLSGRAHAMALASPPPGTSGTIVDVVLSPEPADPLCWTALAIAADERAGEFVMTQGNVAVSAIHECGPARTTSVAWAGQVRQSLPELRALVRRDCSARAWMQFGRAPEVSARAISDLRYGRAARDNFSEMPLHADGASRACPPNLTRWAMPRGDLLRPL